MASSSLSKRWWLLYVTSLPRDVPVHYMSRLFAQFGSLTKCLVTPVKNITNGEKFAIVGFKDPKDAMKVMASTIYVPSQYSYDAPEPIIGDLYHPYGMIKLKVVKGNGWGVEKLCTETKNKEHEASRRIKREKFRGFFTI